VHLCVYQCNDSETSSNISNLSSKIDNYKENIERDELRIVDFKPYMNQHYIEIYLLLTS
jgi:hypothetical protein